MTSVNTLTISPNPLVFMSNSKNTTSDAKDNEGTGKGWKAGRPINNLTKKGNYPSWNTVKSRYWKNKANSPKSIKKYSPENIELMKKGRAPLHNEVGVPKELHHTNGRNIPDPHNVNNLQELWPWEYDAIDPFRHYKGPRP